jgi:hypothetical protein
LKGYIEKAKNAEKFKEKNLPFNEFIENFDKLKRESNEVKDNTTATVDSVKVLLNNLKDGLNVSFISVFTKKISNEVTTEVVKILNIS